MKRSIIAAAAVLLGSGCAHDAEGHRVRSSTLHFDERSVSGPNISYTLEEDGSWAGIGGDRYVLDGGEIRKVGAGFGTGGLIRPSGWVDLERRPDGLVYEPCVAHLDNLDLRHRGRAAHPPEPRSPAVSGRAARPVRGVGRAPHPGSEQAGVELKPDCAVVLFEKSRAGRWQGGRLARARSVPIRAIQGATRSRGRRRAERGVGEPVTGRAPDPATLRERSPET